VNKSVESIPFFEVISMEKEISNTSPYDENFLDCFRTLWQFGDWESLANMDCNILKYHQDRAKLALLVAAGHIQRGNMAEGKQFIRLAQDWGCNKKLLSQILIAGVHNSLGRLAVLTGQQSRAFKHFERSIETCVPGCTVPLITQSRIGKQLAILGLSSNLLELMIEAKDNIKEIPTYSSPSSIGLTESIETLKKQYAELSLQLKKQSDDLIIVRTFLESSFKREILNATKQIEAFIGVQGYFNSGELPNLSTEKHSWPVSPDFALYLIELLESNDYDLIIEFGSGISTVIMAKTLAKIADHKSNSKVKIVSFEHLQQYYNQTLASLKKTGLVDAVQLIHSPLLPYLASNGNTYSYYSCQKVLEDLSKTYSIASLRVFVLVDGPPASTGKHARYPAMPAVLTHFRGAHIDILLDDYIRDDEKEIVQLWKTELLDNDYSFIVTERKLEKEAYLISIGSSKTNK